MLRLAADHQASDVPGFQPIDWDQSVAARITVQMMAPSPGYASGPTGPEPFGDALALLRGDWKPDQMAEATVREVQPFGHPEVEIRLRTSSKDATGYEIMWSALGKKGTPYIAIATWDGPESKPPHYTILKSLKGPEFGISTGDVVKGVIVGQTITAYTNGRLQFQITDRTFATGNPGFGFNEGPSGTYGITSFTASDMVSNDAKSSLTSGPVVAPLGSIVPRCRMEQPFRRQMEVPSSQRFPVAMKLSRRPSREKSLPDDSD